MELEPYSKKKAFALEKLNDINLGGIEAETITKLYEMTSQVIIMTRKRIICVEERAREPQTDLVIEHDQQQFSSSGKHYRYWNVFFKDIIRVGLDLVENNN